MASHIFNILPGQPVGTPMCQTRPDRLSILSIISARPRCQCNNKNNNNSATTAWVLISPDVLVYVNVFHSNTTARITCHYTSLDGRKREIVSWAGVTRTENARRILPTRRRLLILHTWTSSAFHRTTSRAPTDDRAHFRSPMLIWLCKFTHL